MTHLETIRLLAGTTIAYTSSMKINSIFFKANGMITEIHHNGETYWIERRNEGQPSKSGEEIACDIEDREEAIEIAKAKLFEL